MKILHIINSLGSGGAEKLLESSLPKMQQNKDITVEILILTNKNNVFEKKLLKNDIKVLNNNLNVRNPINILKIIKILKKNEYDVIHAHLFPTLYWVAIASKFIGNVKTKYIYTEHSTYNKRRKFTLLKSVEKFIYNSFDKIICITEDTKTNLINWLNLSRNDSKIITIENGIDVEKFDKALPFERATLIPSVNEESIFLCMVSRFSEQKDHNTLIRSLKFLPNNYHLLLVGKGKRYQELINLTAELLLEDRVHFLGFRDDPEKILKASDLIILSSNWEGFGLAALEGMAAGKPVLVSNIEGLSSVVGEAGFIFNQGDSGDLARKIKKIISLNQDEIKEKSKKHAYKYSIEKMVRKHKNLYYDLKVNEYEN